MKNIFLASLLLLIFTACSDDEGSCSQQDWIGTWVLDSNSATCSDPNVSLIEQATISVGSSSSTIDFDGTELSFDGCSASQELFGLNMELDGDMINVDGLGCTGVYIRQ